MDIYVSTYDGSEIDLDDMSVYPEEWKNMTISQLWSETWGSAGKSLFYMNYIHPHVDWKRNGQWKRIDALCHELVSLQKSFLKDNECDKLCYLKWLYRFEDEVENQC